MTTPTAHALQLAVKIKKLLPNISQAELVELVKMLEWETALRDTTTELKTE